MNRPNDPIYGVFVAMLLTVALYLVLAAGCCGALAIETAVLR